MPQATEETISVSKQRSSQTDPSSGGTAAAADDLLRGIFRQVHDRMQVFVDRTAVAKGMVLSLLAGHHVLLLGPPGTAKSLMAQSLCKQLNGGQYFQRLLTKFTTPEELFGPLKFSGLEQDRFERATKGYLPEAHIAFLDEIFKGSSAILNTMLTLLNERLFYNGTEAQQCPLRMVVGASNEFGEDDVEALYDRFLLRYELEYVQDNSVKKLLHFQAPKVAETFTEKDLERAREEVKKIEIPESVFDLLVNVRRELRLGGVIPSDRRLLQCLDLLRAAAWLRGTEVQDEDLLVLENALWSKKEDCAKVTDVVCGSLSPELQRARSILRRAQKKYREILEGFRASPRPQKVRGLQGEFVKATDPMAAELDELTQRAKGEYLAEIENVKQQFQDIRRGVVDVQR